MLKNSYISQKKTFLTFLEMEPCTFQPRLEKKKKKKKNHPKKIYYTYGNRNLKKIYYIFSKESCSHISENRSSEKIIYISGNGTLIQRLHERHVDDTYVRRKQNETD